ncbi:MAG: hypothetical protein K2Q06_05055 [Parvularculaceae bacterium]|nr:hypothetical protein [Parvularculaceae bacterium]
MDASLSDGQRRMFRRVLQVVTAFALSFVLVFGLSNLVLFSIDAIVADEPFKDKLLRDLRSTARGSAIAGVAFSTSIAMGQRHFPISHIWREHSVETRGATIVGWMTILFLGACIIMSAWAEKELLMRH